jgi:hypothetical protein
MIKHPAGRIRPAGRSLGICRPNRLDQIARLLVHDGESSFAGERRTIRARADAVDLSGSLQRSSGDGHKADGTDAEDDDAVTVGDIGVLGSVETRRCKVAGALSSMEIC